MNCLHVPVRLEIHAFLESMPDGRNEGAANFSLCRQVKLINGNLFPMVATVPSATAAAPSSRPNNVWGVINPTPSREGGGNFFLLLLLPPPPSCQLQCVAFRCPAQGEGLETRMSSGSGNIGALKSFGIWQKSSGCCQFAAK